MFLLCCSFPGVKCPPLSGPQVLPRHGESVCVQLFLLAGAVPHLHHRHHADQHLLSGLPGGLFLFHVVWRHRVDAACQIHPATMGLAHRIHLLCDCHEEPVVCELPVKKLSSCAQNHLRRTSVTVSFCHSCVFCDQLGSCAYLDSLLKNGCWLIQAFSMFCTIKGYDVRK